MAPDEKNKYGYTTARISRIPLCDFCKKKPARYDFKTIHGPWAYGCRDDYLANRMYDSLGSGRGQELILRES